MRAVRAYLCVDVDAPDRRGQYVQQLRDTHTHTEKRNSRGVERQSKLKTITAPDSNSPAQVSAHAQYLGDGRALR